MVRRCAFFACCSEPRLGLTWLSSYCCSPIRMRFLTAWLFFLRRSTQGVQRANLFIALATILYGTSWPPLTMIAGHLVMASGPFLLEDSTLRGFFTPNPEYPASRAVSVVS